MWPHPSSPTISPREAASPPREGAVEYLVPGPDGELVPASDDDLEWILAYERERAAAGERLMAACRARHMRRGWLVAPLGWVRWLIVGSRWGRDATNRSRRSNEAI